MKTLVRLAAFLLLLSGAAVWAQSNNPYMPAGHNAGSGTGGVAVPEGMTPDQRDQLMEALMAGAPPGDASGSSFAPNNAFQELRSQQADDVDAIAREKADRENEIKALKEAFDNQIHDLQRKIDQQQVEIDDLRYRDRF